MCRVKQRIYIAQLQLTLFLFVFKCIVLVCSCFIFPLAHLLPLVLPVEAFEWSYTPFFFNNILFINTHDVLRSQWASGP